MIEHRSLSNFVQDAVDSYEINENDRVLQFASLSFEKTSSFFEEVMLRFIFL